MPRVHATFSTAQARHAVYMAACKHWHFAAGEIPWESRMIRKLDVAEHTATTHFLLKKSASDRQVYDFMVTQKQVNKLWSVTSIQCDGEEVYQLLPFSYTRSEELPYVSGSAEEVKYYLDLVEALRDGERFYVVERDPTSTWVTVQNVIKFLFVTEDCRVIPYSNFELLSGHFFLNQGELPVLNEEQRRSWEAHIFTTALGRQHFYYDNGREGHYSYVEFSGWLRKVYGDQFLRFMQKTSSEFVQFLNGLAKSAE